MPSKPKRKPRRPSLLLAFGGHVLAFKETEFGQTTKHPLANRCMEAVVELYQQGYDKIIMTHGNGPQVGELLLRQHLLRTRIQHPVTLDAMVADTQGRLGYALQQIFDNLCEERGINKKTSTVITQVVVDPKDKAFKSPDKPVGAFYDKEEAQRLRKKHRWNIKLDKGRGYRRVVPSPEPIEIVEAKIFKTLLKLNFLAIGAGGGGIPVYRDKNDLLHGVEAVIDKDKTSALLANLAGIHTLVILTEVSEAYLHYRTSRQRPIGAVRLSTMKRHLRDGQFYVGSMRPKVEAAIRFVERGGKRAIITSVDYLFEALEGNAGTIVTP